mgnify:CR=1 FL=1
MCFGQVTHTFHTNNQYKYMEVNLVSEIGLYLKVEVDVRARQLLTTVNFGTARSRLKKSKRAISFVMVST